MFFTVLFALALLIVAICIVQTVLSRAHRVPPDPPTPYATPLLVSAAMSPLLQSVPAAASPRFPSVPAASSSMLLFQPMSPPAAALIPEDMSTPSPLFEAMPLPPPPPTVDDEFLGLFDQMSITPRSQQVHSQTTEMWHVPWRAPPLEDLFPELTEEEREFGVRAFLQSLLLRVRNQDHDNGGDPRRYAVANRFLQEHYD
ncbi:hypothetical protein BJV82DRAFT_670521 [Fennellomyces sp. T-0311]|nr:hypothetical protein BJV82DRAFT_670521 [Fennellomyces sp. T-0311]